MRTQSAHYSFPLHLCWYCLRILQHYNKSRSGWQDSNLRPSGPKPDALPTALHPDMFYQVKTIVLFSSGKDIWRLNLVELVCFLNHLWCLLSAIIRSLTSGDTQNLSSSPSSFILIDLVSSIILLFIYPVPCKVSHSAWSSCSLKSCTWRWLRDASCVSLPFLLRWTGFSKLPFYIIYFISVAGRRIELLFPEWKSDVLTTIRTRQVIVKSDKARILCSLLCRVIFQPQRTTCVVLIYCVSATAEWGEWILYFQVYLILSTR